MRDILISASKTFRIPYLCKKKRISFNSKGFAGGFFFRHWKFHLLRAVKPMKNGSSSEENKGKIEESCPVSPYLGNQRRFTLSNPV